MNLDDLAEWWAIVRGCAPDGSWQNVWATPSRQSRWCRANFDAVAQAVGSAASSHASGIYLSAALYDEATTDRLLADPRHRGKAVDATWVTALWADVDWHTGEDHKAAVLGDRDAADDVVDNLGKVGLAPSVIVSTGGGYHLWWPLVEPAPAAEGSAMCWRIQNITRHVAANLGVDYTFDAARVMRCPGTINFKPSHGPNGAPVTVDFAEEVSFGESFLLPQFEILEKCWRLHSQRVIDFDPTANGELRIPGDAEHGAVVMEMLDDAGMLDARLSMLWHHGLGSAAWLGDQSPSAATMAVMSRIWRALCLDTADVAARQTAAQAALDVGAAWRQRWAPDAKMARRDWWQRTLGRITAQTNQPETGPMTFPIPVTPRTPQ